ncbi:MAG: class I SAM-dependent methyltransferase [Rubrivivax sp.]|nr:class I SAM-dependent methyltransferase [Rubrivivax sp.]
MSETAVDTIPVPTDEAFLREALEALPVCIEHCGCPDHWHALWAGLKATGVLRGVHAQATFLRGMLKPYLVPGGRVMIAGAADTGSLEVLNAVIADPAARFCVVDRCEAPLELVRRRAATLGLELETVYAGLDEVRAGQPWDLVFIHYTLSFMDPASRRRMLEHLRQDLSGQGAVVCAVRHKQAGLAGGAAGPAGGWIDSIGRQLRQTYAGRPELLEPLLAWLPDYAHARQRREDAMPHFDVLRDEFADAGFALREVHRNPGQAVTRVADLSPAGSVTTWLAVFTPQAA